MIRARDVTRTGVVYVDLETLTPRVALALVRLFDGYGDLSFNTRGDRPYMGWTWGNMERGDVWIARANALRSALQDRELIEYMTDEMSRPL